MPAPQNPKKKALMPSGPLRRSLRAAGHHLTAIVQVGKEGATEAVTRQLDQALLDHELVKVKVGTESPEDRFEAAERLAAGAQAQLAQILGRTLLLYRKHPRKPKFEPGPAEDARGAAPEPRSAGRAPARKRTVRKGSFRKGR
ncbi:ribosome assembly RNA-binding protein YhbY [Anaeromyxobacter diazotrophicus]|uniref:ribosome assembly RNA-binding protein YhbY n=1 Tax=Anaeromyxobacter diazotrophicus TaxID=2590199 RepID=UPI001F00F12C|nr:ribosome assembly RNA-binding protein YhbY [Anaeromyxobacter diazotrophicus]